MALKYHIIGQATIVMGEWDTTNKPEIGAYLLSGELENLVEKIGQEVIVVLGGDGVMLEAIDAYRDRDVPFFGINFGTVGYLMYPREILPDSQRFETTHHPLLKATINANGAESHHYAFGDLYMKPRDGGGTVKYSAGITLPQETSIGVSDVIGDGIIVSTPAGSTGYAGNVGADRLPMSSQELVIAHIAPPRDRGIRPIHVPNTSTIHITPHETDRRPTLIYTDGRVIHSSDGPLALSIRKATKGVRLLVADNYQDQWHTRSYRGDGYQLVI